MITDYAGSRILQTYRELNNKSQADLNFSIFNKKRSNSELPPPQVPEKSPGLSSNNKLSKPLKVRFALTVLILAIGVLCICRDSTEAGVALCSAVAGYWLK